MICVKIFWRRTPAGEVFRILRFCVIANNARDRYIWLLAQEFHIDREVLVRKGNTEPADLEMPEGVAFAGRENLDGLSIRLLRQYDINNDNIPCRLDILHGFQALRPEWACRVMGAGA